ncbi:uncharacterized protein LOC133196903 [Saccostrea echinata]|uniref:uncharacterized protein LOC133196903 n=1 Tax=Saccostrea echinata TaxID=191078 RepID=UPI002A80CFB3|nr:uncharacterized protein LOC133196903 [Saccostrea echinata]
MFGKQYNLTIMLKLVASFIMRSLIFGTFVDCGFSFNFQAKLDNDTCKKGISEKKCVLHSTIPAREILILSTGIKIKPIESDIFVVTFRTRNITQIFHFFCSNNETGKPEVVLSQGEYNKTENHCSEKDQIKESNEYWINNKSKVRIKFKDETCGTCEFTTNTGKCIYLDFLFKSEAMTFSLGDISSDDVPKRENPTVIMLSVFAAEMFIILVFLGVWQLMRKYRCFNDKTEMDFFDVRSGRNIITDTPGLFPSPPLSHISSRRSSKISEHPSNSSAEENREEPGNSLENEADTVPLPVEDPVVPTVEKGSPFTKVKDKTKRLPPQTLPKPIRKQLEKMLDHPKLNVNSSPLTTEELPRTQMVKAPQNIPAIPGFLLELEQKQRCILRTKIKNNFDRDSRIVSTEIEHIEVLNKKCKRSTYMDMSGMEKLRRHNDEEGIYENMTALRRIGQMIGRADKKNEHMCSRIIGKEEAHYYEIGSAECESILGNLKDRNPERPVIWNVKTREREYNYITKIDAREEVNSRKRWTKFRTSKHSSLEPHYISVFFDDRSNTDSIGTGSDFDRLSYVSALDGIFRSSTNVHESTHNAHFAYVFDGLQDAKLPVGPSHEFTNKGFEESLEHSQSCVKRLSIESSDSGLSDEDSKNNDCLFCQYNEKVVYVNISEFHKPDIPPRGGGLKALYRRGSAKSKIVKNEEIRVRVVGNESEQGRSTMYIE